MKEREQLPIFDTFYGSKKRRVIDDYGIMLWELELQQALGIQKNKDDGIPFQIHSTWTALCKITDYSWNV